jgi:hypothetical protein
MCLLIKRASILFVVVLFGCSQQKRSTTATFYDIDSLVNVQVKALQGFTLNKSVQINGKNEKTSFVPDSLQWVHELDIFRQLAEINKASFRDAYVITDSRDPNSNLTVRELKSNRPVPVSSVKFYFLRTLNDLRRIEATLTQENALYVNDRNMTLELNDVHKVHSYRIEGAQKMVMSDSVRFIIAGDVVD